MTGPVGSGRIESGKTDKIKVTINPIGRNGKLRKIVTVSSNDPVRPVQEVNIYATVKHTVKLRPSFRMETVLFSKKCRSCHADQGKGEKGRFLYDAICAFCHGIRGEGWSTGPFRKRSDDYVRELTAFGKRGTQMPGYSKSRGGPLDDEQIESLVEYVRALTARLTTKPAGP